MVLSATGGVSLPTGSVSTVDFSFCASGDATSPDGFGCGVDAWLTRALFLGGMFAWAVCLGLRAHIMLVGCWRSKSGRPKIEVLRHDAQSPDTDTYVLHNLNSNGSNDLLHA